MVQKGGGAVGGGGSGGVVQRDAGADGRRRPRLPEEKSGRVRAGAGVGGTWRRRMAAETAFAAVLGTSAVYIAFNEGFANRQALWLAAVLISLSAVLMRPPDAQG